MHNLAFLDLSTTELIIILIIILLLFGGKKLPELTRSINQSRRELKKGLDDGSKTASKKSNKS